MNTQVFIDPKVNIHYGSFYLQGLINKFGKENLKFDLSYFEKLKGNPMCMNFVVCSNNEYRKYTIDFNDFCTIKEQEYEWCDVYGHVNANRSQTPEYMQGKLVSLAPSFGVRLWGLPATVFYGLDNMLKISEKINRKKFLGKYKKQYSDRINYENYYNHDTAEENYIFHLSTLWHNDEWNKNDENVNLSRHFFISACKSLKSVFFEGGLASNNQICNTIFESSVFSGRMSVKEYVEKTKKSTLVFNTPAFWDCHGWKLGEYLAMGKAIISTPLINDLPEPLIHGRNVHFVENNEESIRQAIEQLLDDKDYRKKLQQGALNYWNEYGTPQKSLELLGIK